MTRRLTLPTDSATRKDVPMLSGCLNYFPAALAGVARWSKIGNDKHNPGEPLHHARGKSMDHGDCIIRHTMDLSDLMAKRVVWTAEEQQAILDEVDARSWRALADAQKIHEMFGAPLAPAAKHGPEQREKWEVTTMFPLPPLPLLPPMDNPGIRLYHGSLEAGNAVPALEPGEKFAADKPVVPAVHTNEEVSRVRAMLARVGASEGGPAYPLDNGANLPENKPTGYQNR